LLSRTFDSTRDIAPTVRPIDCSLSFRMISRSRSRWPALFSASSDMPDTMLASPTTATDLRFSPLSASPRQAPSAIEIAVPAWPEIIRSYGDSSLCGNPERPPFWRSVWKRSKRPVSSLCG
jgi:hypothetical protein